MYLFIQLVKLPASDSNETDFGLNPVESAKFVQCIHTSSDKGTKIRSCHQNWIMGNCGLNQAASGLPLWDHINYALTFITALSQTNFLLFQNRRNVKIQTGFHHLFRAMGYFQKYQR